LARDVLDYLLSDRSGSWVSGEEMALSLGVTRTAIWKQVQSLRIRGYQIEASTRKGYRLKERPDIVDPDLVRLCSRARLLGREILWFKEVSSTNEIARRLAPEKEEGTVILAETQIDGRGRMARMWHSPAGGVWMSLILKPKIQLYDIHKINMVVDLGIVRALEGLYGLKAGIKWPNDLLLGEKKVCGILTEIAAEVDQLQYAIVGVGINANVDIDSYLPELNATSLCREIGSRVSRPELVGKILEEIEQSYLKMSSPEIYREWCDRSATIGKQVKVISRSGEIRGKAASLSPDGALCLELSDGKLQRVLAGDCVHLREG
jgi:BirA family transcriptional regulator, biotin operon repressor / biotin---[acetyl-CoA-carboxylase] ligase